MAKILVTGGAGMIGSNLVRRLMRDGHDVSVVDNLWRGKLDYLMEGGRAIINLDTHFHNVDLSLQGSCDHLVKEADYVYHLADIVAGINYVFANQGSLFRQNFLINSNIIEAIRNSDVKGFIYVGTACSFPAALQSSRDSVALKEDDLYPAAPESAYGWSKLMGQYETELMAKESGIASSVLMLHNVYGSPADFSPQRGQVIPSLIRKAIRFPDESFEVWGSGEQSRAFVHVSDVIEALVLAMEKGFGQEVMQIGPDYSTTIREIAEAVVGISRKDIEIQYDTSKPEGDRSRCADYSRAKRILGWEPRMPLHEGLGEVYQWVKRQIDLKTL